MPDEDETTALIYRARGSGDHESVDANTLLNMALGLKSPWLNSLANRQPYHIDEGARPT
jgi:hypothetical protein